VARGAAASQHQLASRWWAVGCLLGIGLWIGITAFVAARHTEPGDARAATLAFVVCGAVFFGVVFGVAGVQMRRMQMRARIDLYDRLALTPVSPATVRRAARGASQVGYVYLTFGVLVTALGLAAIGVADERWSSWLFGVTIALVVLWFVYMGIALRQVYSSTDELFAPLGLRLVDMPSYVVDWIGEGRRLVGAMTYAGTRHGRELSITHEPARAVTIARGEISAGSAPSTPARMAALTGEPARCWRGVEVERDAGQVTVVRKGNGAGAWFLHDLLLVELVAAG
jgi:NADH:ubiquinone oxidoreductase subunit 6 (subunit J)